MTLHRISGIDSGVGTGVWCESSDEIMFGNVMTFMATPRTNCLDMGQNVSN